MNDFADVVSFLYLYMEAFIQWCLDNLNYWTVALLMAIESSFIPFPSEIVVPPAAYKAAAGELNLFGVITAATFGAMCGAIVNYAISYKLGRPFVYWFVNTKFGHMCLLSQEKMERAESYFREHGISSTLVGRLVPAVRQLISIPAGLSKMNFFKFILFTAIGATLWNSVLAFIGYALHAAVPKDQLASAVSEYKPYLTIGGVVLFLLFVSYLVISGIIKKKKGSTSINQ